ncbi:unnamed protein product [Trichobilharzia regenti]|nr:unnamed protein product [Trichobilharzia regenti]
MCFTHLITFWSHSIEHAENGIGEAGGTLCVATSNSIAVSGGGNCETWVYFIDSKLEIVSAESVCLRNHNGQVTAVDISSRYIATGSKDKVSFSVTVVLLCVWVYFSHK